MKIMQFIFNLAQGGAEAVVKDYSLNLSKKGNDVEVVVLLPFTNSENEKILIENGVKIRSIYQEIYSHYSMDILSRLIRKPLRNLKVKKWLINYLGEFNPDVIHVHLSLLNYINMLDKELINRKIIYTCHNEVEYYFGKKNKKDVKIVNELQNKCDFCMIALHEKMEKELKKKFPKIKTYTVYNPISIKRFLNPKINKYEMRDNLGIRRDSLVIGNNGRFIEQKNHRFLIDVFFEVKKVEPKAFLLLIGYGYLENEIRDKLNDAGYQNDYLILSNRRDIPELLNCMDVFVFPSLFEGFGIALVEAEISGLKCIVSNTIPDAAFINNCVCQLGIKKENINEWKNAILNENINYIETSRTMEDFDINKIIEKLEKIYSE